MSIIWSKTWHGLEPAGFDVKCAYRFKFGVCPDSKTAETRTKCHKDLKKNSICWSRAFKILWDVLCGVEAALRWSALFKTYHRPFREQGSISCCDSSQSLAWHPFSGRKRLIFRTPYSHMMTSSNGNIFCVTGLLCGEFTGHRWISRTKGSDAELWCFLWSAPE